MRSTNYGWEDHSCGILRQFSDDNRTLFFTGGKIYYHPRSSSSRTGRYTGSTYSSGMYNLDNPKSWQRFNGIPNSGYKSQFVNVSPYEGFIFLEHYSDEYNTWYVWNGTTVEFELSKNPRDTSRSEFALAAIPISSPMVKNCK